MAMDKHEYGHAAKLAFGLTPEQQKFKRYLTSLLVMTIFVPAIMAFVLVYNYMRGNPVSTVIWQIVLLFLILVIFVARGWLLYRRSRR